MGRASLQPLRGALLLPAAWRACCGAALRECTAAYATRCGVASPHRQARCMQQLGCQPSEGACVRARMRGRVVLRWRMALAA
eukprot:13129114-Alexandrium_andersonii.AAC.1